MDERKHEVLWVKKNYIIGFYSISLSILIYYLMAVFIYNNYIPDVSSLLNKASEIFAVRLSFAPEPVERLLYLIGIVSLPILLVVFALLGNIVLKKAGESPVNIIYYTSVILSIIRLLDLFYLSLTSFGEPNVNNLEFYFFNSFFYKHPILYTVIIFPLIVIGLFALEKYKNFFKENIAYKMSNVLSVTVSFLLLATVFLMCVFSANYVNNSGIFIYHFDSVFYPVTQVYRGKALLVDINSLYGLYPHFLDLIFKIIGLNVLKFTIVMGTLLLFSYLFISLFLQKVVENVIFRLLGFTTIIWSYLFSRVSVINLMHDCYFQYYPLRTIFPCVLIYVAAIYFHKQSKILYYFSMILFSVAVLWNPDTGLVVLGAWLFGLCYREFFNNNKKTAMKKSLLHIAICALVFLVSIVSFMTFIYFRNGTFPDLSLLFVYQKLYYIYGYFMLPMPISHPWNLVILIYMIGIFYATICLLTRKMEYRATLVGILTVLGVGLFTYYQGRSHNWNIVSVSYPAIILLVIYADDLWRNFREYGWHIAHNAILFLIVLYIMSFSFFSIIDNTKGIYAHVRNQMASVFQRSSEIARNIAFIKKYVVRGEKIFIFSGNESIYYAETETQSCLNNMNFRDIYYKEEVLKILDYLKKNPSNKIFYELGFCGIPDYYPLHEIIEVLTKEYRVVDISENKKMFLLSNR